MPDGIVLLDADNTIIWGNGRLKEWTGHEKVVGANFYSMLGSPEILGPDFCPFHTALATGRPSSSTLRSGENHYFQVHAAPLFEAGQPAQHLIVTVRDVTSEMLQQQKLAAIHQAGVELADLTPDELSHMTVEERIKLLKSNILHFTKDLLNFDVVEIRLLDAKTGKLEPLLSVGLMPEAANRELYAQPQNNGVTGFVAATGKSYLCEDTTADPLYLEGCRGAKSSLTVPLVLHDEVIGTFNVESPDAAGIHRKRLAVPRDLHPRRGRGAQHAGVVASRKGFDRGRKRRSHPQRRGAAGGRHPERRRQHHGALYRPRAAGGRTAAEHPAQRPRHQAIDPEGRPKDGSRPSAAHLVAVRRSTECCATGGFWWPMPTRASAARPTICWSATAASSKRPTTAAKRSSWFATSALEGNYDVIIADIRLPDMSGYDLLVKLQDDRSIRCRWS